MKSARKYQERLSSAGRLHTFAASVLFVAAVFVLPMEVCAQAECSAYRGGVEVGVFAKADKAFWLLSQGDQSGMSLTGKMTLNSSWLFPQAQNLPVLKSGGMKT